MDTLSWVALIILSAAVSAVALFAAGHAVLFKRDPRAAFGWVAICLMFPVAGPVLYFVFGVNRIHTRARKLHGRPPLRLDLGYERSDAPGGATLHPAIAVEHEDIATLSDAVTHRPMVAGNEIAVLENGEDAYPEMLAAIDGAGTSAYLCTYIFQADGTGQRFIDALASARERGVDVRVIVDGFGALYSLPRTVATLMAKRGIPMTRFLPPTLVPPTLYVNLRTHRKLLVVDGKTGFTGGMNIGDRHLVRRVEPPSLVRDLQFRVSGPVVAQMQQAFLDDWHFCTGEQTQRASTWAPEGAHTDGAVCRVITDGPNEDLDKLATVMLGAIHAARHRIGIVTPYFLPSREMISALQTAVLRGVKTSLVLPSRNNLPYVHWATRNMLWEVVRRGVAVFYQPPPFDHSKLFVVDDYYAQIGSANIDPRSLRLNFELAVEVFDRDFAGTLWARIESLCKGARPVSLEELDARSLPVRARDALAWLFSPYL
jgi:cardiolipin synthase